MTLSAGTRLGPYEIGALIGSGGMGEVYRARDTRLGRLVAVKVLAGRVTDVALRQRFEREAAAIAAVTHPNICRLYDIGVEGALPFLVMEYLDGETLAQRIVRGPVPLDEALAIATSMAAAAHAAHEQGLVHRDLKPANVMLTADGVKLLDFGLVRVIAEPSDAGASADTVSALTGDGDVVGTIQYMAPEQVQGGAVDRRCDIFAIGVIMYEMLTGRAPFARPSWVRTVAAICTDTPPPVRDVRAEVPAALARVIERCLAKDPDARWPDASSLAAALRPQPNRGRHAPKPTPARSRPTRAAAPIRRVAVLPMRNVSGDDDQNYLADGLTEALMSALVEIQGLEIISRASAERLAVAPNDIAALALSTGVDAYLEGSVARAGDHLRVAVRFVSAASSAHIWAATYEREWGDLLALEHDIASSVASEVQLKLSSGTRRRTAKRTTDPLAQDAYLRGRFLRSQGGADALRLAFKYFNRALEIDPDYPALHAALADWYLTAAVARVIPASAAIPKAKAASLRALELGPDIAEAHSCLGRVATYEWDFALAQSELEAALKINPSLADAEVWLGRLFQYLCQFERAIEHCRAAQRLDPLSPRSHANIAATYYCARKFDQAIAEAHRALELSDDFGNALYLIGMSECFRGRLNIALQQLEAAQRVAPEHPSPITGTILVLARLGRAADAAALLNRLKDRATRADVSPYDFAEAYAGLGELDLAIEHLQRSYSLRLPELLGICSDPIFDSIRGDARFIALAQDVGLMV